MKYFLLDPDVPGRLSSDTINELKRNRSINSITYIFECWPDDDIAQADPFYIISNRLAAALISHGVTGCEIKDCRVEKGDQFNIVSPGFDELPAFKWLNITGNAGFDDFGITRSLNLVISERAYKILEKFNTDACDITPL